ncbi:arginine-tRNA-protein transferase [Lipomyces kononenkoae]|uniref:Arginine-tRNA-protein transferase n=1 Tax=Lipomyces kononenkoae TaxID=34357 RepID=A0ACC3ST96_LIPKO
MLLDGTPIAAILPGHYIGERRCGYCHRTSGSCVFGFTSVSMTVDFYQRLMDRGFRRSGAFLYKPDTLNSCCPQYTIRLKASDFKPSKEHRQAVNRFNRFILGPQYEEALRRHNSSSHSASSYVIFFCLLTRPPNDSLGKHNPEFDLIGTIHRAEYDYLPQELSHIPTAHKFVVRLVRPDCTDEKFELYRHYQKTCHHEPDSKITRHGFKRFLCGQPFEFEQNSDPHALAIAITEGGHQPPTKRLGLWHQLYYLDNQLIAMAVLDILPDSVSSVYFMCREDFSKYSLGKLSACREIALALEDQRTYYHMGLYIYSCQKMKYKASFSPSEILDPELYRYFPFDKFAAEFKKSNYVSFAQSHNGGDITKEPRDPMAPETKINNQHEERYDDDADDDDDDDDYSEKDDEGHMPVIRTVFDTDMPGIARQLDVESRIDMSKVRVIIQNYVFTGENLANMHPSVFARLLDPILQMAAVVGLDLLYEVFLYFQ